MPETIPYVDSTQYYNANVRDIRETAKGLDLSFIYDLFLPYLSKGATILDAGCGSGRDAKHFLEQGFNVVAFDGAPEMAKYASENTGIAVEHRMFTDISEVEEYDGIWTSASLLHVRKQELPAILEKLYRALKPGGLWYLSFREGESEENDGDRYFNNQTEESLEELLNVTGPLEFLELSTPEQVRNRRGFKFVVAVVRKSENVSVGEELKTDDPAS